jgi:hypothetical protein
MCRYVAFVLDEWSDQPMFLRLQAVQHHSHLPMRGAFDAAAQLYRHVWRQRSADLVEAMVDELHSLVSIYGEERWYGMISIEYLFLRFSMDSHHQAMEMTPSLSPFLLTLRSRLSTLSSTICTEAFSSLLSQEITTKLSLMFIHHLLHRTTFT